ncbi:MAG: PGAP1-like protein-domain-containing protein [Benjaminiella poitrasii]|nr:MAG: PGAP1-like protein-domain-containing protein [Benjaminiella poitrasii]
MFLGLTRYEVSRKSRYERVRINGIIGFVVLTTLLVMFVMLDSFSLHLPSTSAVISPLQRQDVQNCVMSYSYPTFFEIESPNSTFSKKYKLYLYREGYLDQPDKLYGVPALFIPGQAGSHKQIRSLASVTTNQYHTLKRQNNVDFFTVDLNEEFSAFSGQTLLDQAEYMNQAIERILSLYDSNQSSSPTSVILVGHSMGGLVARTMLMLPNYIPKSIKTILTLATPHLSAPILLDVTLYKVYQDLTRYWQYDNSNQYYNTTLKDVTIISIAGGSLDTIIHSDGVQMTSLVPARQGFTTYTTSIPGVWTGTDHMAILWCNQLIRLLATTMLDVADLGMDSTVEERMRIFKYYLLEGGPSSIVKYQDNADSIILKNVRQSDMNEYVLFDINNRKPNAVLPITTHQWQFLTNIDEIYDMCWSIVSCQNQTDNHNDIICHSTPPKATVLPSATEENLAGSLPYRLLTIDNDSIRNSHYLSIIQHCQITNAKETPFIQAFAISYQPVRHTQSIWDIMWNGLSFDADSFYSVHEFPLIHNSLFAFDINVISIKSLKKDAVMYKPMMQQMMHKQEIKYYRGLENGVSDRITFHQENTATKDGGLSLRFFTDNQKLQIRFKLDWYGTLGRCVLRYGAVLANFLWISTLALLSTQLYSYVLNGKREFIEYPRGLVYCLSGPYLQITILLCIATSIQYYCSFKYNFPVLKYMLLGNDDWLLTSLLIFAFVLAIGLTTLLWLTVSALVFFLSLPLRLIFYCFSGNVTISSSNQTGSFELYSFLCHLSIVIGLLSFLPSSVIFVIYLLIWLFLTCCARISAQSDLPSFQNVYKYRQSCLIFFISLLPYYVPHVVVYCKDLFVGWTHYRLAPITIAQDAPVLLALLYLVTMGRTPESLELRYVYI